MNWYVWIFLICSFFAIKVKENISTPKEVSAWIPNISSKSHNYSKNTITHEDTYIVNIKFYKNMSCKWGKNYKKYIKYIIYTNTKVWSEINSDVYVRVVVTYKSLKRHVDFFLIINKFHTYCYITLIHFLKY